MYTYMDGIQMARLLCNFTQHSIPWPAKLASTYTKGERWHTGLSDFHAKKSLPVVGNKPMIQTL